MTDSVEDRLTKLEKREGGANRTLVLGFIALIITVIASVAGGYGALVATQSTLLTAFQTGVTLHEAR